MFTGIIEEIGRTKSIRRDQDWCQIEFEAEKILEGAKIGDSISVNGVCLTLTALTDRAFSVDVMPETLSKTSLSQLRIGSPVNLERAMVAGGRFNGHFVSGHIDGTGKIIDRKNYGNSVLYRIEAPSELLTYIIPKGSIAVDGISLTVVDTNFQSFTISIIPHTLEKTVLQYQTINDIVNLECDIMGKYIEHFFSLRFENQKNRREKSRITEAFLNEHGFK